LEWLANITNAKTRRAYKIDVAEFIAFTNLKNHSALRTVVRAHVIAWRKDMETRSLAPTSIRRKLSALSSDAGDGGDECAFKRSGHRQSAGMARTR
jgi:integrase/recombinase XerD